MARIKLTNEQFKNIISTIVDDIRRVHERKFYEVEFSDDNSTVYVTPEDNFPFYATYLNKVMALDTLYDITMWFEVRDGKPCLSIFNE